MGLFGPRSKLKAPNGGRTKICVVLLFIMLTVMQPRPAEAQWIVHDPINLIEIIANFIETQITNIMIGIQTVWNNFLLSGMATQLHNDLHLAMKGIGEHNRALALAHGTNMQSVALANQSGGYYAKAIIPKTHTACPTTMVAAEMAAVKEPAVVNCQSYSNGCSSSFGSTPVTATSTLIVPNNIRGNNSLGGVTTFFNAVGQGQGGVFSSTPATREAHELCGLYVFQGTDGTVYTTLDPNKYGNLVFLITTCLK
jgi:hypothetical protein